MPSKKKKKKEKDAPLDYKKDGPLFQNDYHNSIVQGFMFFALAVAVGIIIYGIRVYEDDQPINNFRECTLRKNSIVQESYPATCVTKDGQKFTEDLPTTGDYEADKIIQDVITTKLNGSDFRYLSDWGTPEITQLSTRTAITFENGLGITTGEIYNQDLSRAITIEEYLEDMPEELIQTIDDDFVHYKIETESMITHIISQDSDSTDITIITYPKTISGITQNYIRGVLEDLDNSSDSDTKPLTKEEATIKVQLLPDVSSFILQQNARVDIYEDDEGWIFDIYSISEGEKTNFATYKVDKYTGSVTKSDTPQQEQ